jgi:hypothetical protein
MPCGGDAALERFGDTGLDVRFSVEHGVSGRCAHSRVRSARSLKVLLAGYVEVKDSAASDFHNDHKSRTATLSRRSPGPTPLKTPSAACGRNQY